MFIAEQYASCQIKAVTFVSVLESESQEYVHKK